MRCLVCYDDEHRRRLLTLAPGQARGAIGRSRDAALCVGWDSQVSRVHAELERVRDHWLLADEGLSRNGTYLNENRITGRRLLADHAVVPVGLTTIPYREPGAPTEASTALGDEAELASTITAAQRR